LGVISVAWNKRTDTDQTQEENGCDISIQAGMIANNL